MTCEEARELFSAEVDARLLPEQRAGLERHLATCPECSQERERFGRTIALLRSVEEARAPAGFASRVLEAVRREPWPRRVIRGLVRPVHVKLPLEAASIVLVSTLVFLLYRQTAPPGTGAGSPGGTGGPPSVAVEAPAEVRRPVSAPSRGGPSGFRRGPRCPRSLAEGR
jgi:anti-sigma factor RsiW